MTKYRRGLLDTRLRAFYDPDDQLTASMLVDLQSGNDDRGVCGLPFTRQSDGETVYISDEYCRQPVRF
ncbi:Uncharacterised protein [Klebsiella michiganensis]|uniref:Uncharacterized protein n=1 Tax=Klebsiella michiganensis TaxID=1134687 RepID=A0A7H4N2M9_9ENTR|nr:Uncharacterised protein [Klebsiella michiganensis]